MATLLNTSDGHHAYATRGVLTERVEVSRRPKISGLDTYVQRVAPLAETISGDTDVGLPSGGQLLDLDLITTTNPSGAVFWGKTGVNYDVASVSGGSSAFLLACWIRPKSDMSSQKLLSLYPIYGHDPVGTLRVSYDASSRQLDVKWTFPASQHTVLMTSGVGVPPDGWAHVAITATNTESALWINGTKEDTVGDASAISPMSVARLYFYKAPSYMADLRIARGLSAGDPIEDVVKYLAFRVSNIQVTANGRDVVDHVVASAEAVSDGERAFDPLESTTTVMHSTHNDGHTWARMYKNGDTIDPRKLTNAIKTADGHVCLTYDDSHSDTIADYSNQTQFAFTNPDQIDVESDTDTAAGTNDSSVQAKTNFRTSFDATAIGVGVNTGTIGMRLTPSESQPFVATLHTPTSADSGFKEVTVPMFNQWSVDNVSTAMVRHIELHELPPHGGANTSPGGDGVMNINEIQLWRLASDGTLTNVAQTGTAKLVQGHADRYFYSWAGVSSPKSPGPDYNDEAVRSVNNGVLTNGNYDFQFTTVPIGKTIWNGYSYPTAAQYPIVRITLAEPCPMTELLSAVVFNRYNGGKGRIGRDKVVLIGDTGDIVSQVYLPDYNSTAGGLLQYSWVDYHPELITAQHTTTQRSDATTKIIATTVANETHITKEATNIVQGVGSVTGKVYVDYRSDGAWMAIGSAPYGRLSKRLSENSSIVDWIRSDAYAGQLAISWTSADPYTTEWIGGQHKDWKIDNYDAAVRFDFSVDDDTTLTGSDSVTWTKTSATSTPTDITVMKGDFNNGSSSAGEMYYNKNTFAARYDQAYGLAYADHNSQLDWGPDDQRFAVIYVSVNSGVNGRVISYPGWNQYWHFKDGHHPGVHDHLGKDEARRSVQRHPSRIHGPVGTCA